MRRGIGLARTLLGASALGFSALGLSASASALPTNRVACQPSALRAAPPVASVLKLASTVQAPGRPTVVLVHGLDSSKETWKGVLGDLAARGYPAVAFDLRGHGETALGDPDDFSPSALAADVLEAVRSQGLSDVVLVGHSMGGRVAMRAAAIDAASSQPVLGAVIIEDMDTDPRLSFTDPNPPSKAVEAWAARDGRRFADWPSARQALLASPASYDEARVDGWRGSRVRAQPDGSWWSDINPAARRLAGIHVLASRDGSEAWDELAGKGGELRFDVHVWHADNEGKPGGTVCSLRGDDGIEGMARRLPAAQVRFFVGSGHSIHNTARDEFVAALCGVVDATARRAPLA